MRYYISEQRYINTYTMSILLFLSDHGGETIGFRDMTANMHIGSSTLRKYMNELTTVNLVKEEYIGNISKFKLTEKGRKIVDLIKMIFNEISR